MFDYSSLYINFTTNNKSCIIAPAGYGKSYTIAESLNYTKGHQLILTHTHAGVASLKEKIKKIDPIGSYTIETISSFAKKYVKAFYCGSDLPEEESNDFFPFILKKATELFMLKPIMKIISITYSGLFVDEYQDCTISQHHLIQALSKNLSTHILGDPLQGIFNFNNEKLIDFNSDLIEYKNVGELEEPWRWKNTNLELGEMLKDIRFKLENKKQINLNDYKNITGFNFLKGDSKELEQPSSIYRKWINGITYNPNNKSWLKNILIITPLSFSVWERVALNKKLSYKYRILEAFDEKDFYQFAKKIDEILSQTEIYSDLVTLLRGKRIMRKGKKDKRTNTLLTNLNVIFSNEQRIPKITKRTNTQYISIYDDLAKLEINKDKILLLRILKALSAIAEVKCTRIELFRDLYRAIEQSIYNKNSVYESMKDVRNIKRRNGRRTNIKCIGTTLLTKGLEFDTVVILDTDKFDCPKNLYVALTRASQHLVVFSNNEVLSPY